MSESMDLNSKISQAITNLSEKSKKQVKVITRNSYSLAAGQEKLEKNVQRVKFLNFKSADFNSVELTGDELVEGFENLYQVGKLGINLFQ